MAIVFDMAQVKESARRALEGLGIDAVEQMQKTVPFASGHLKDNIDFKVTEEGDKIVLEINMPFYAKFVEYGTPPHFPPLEAIVEWCVSKGIPIEAAYPIAKAMSEQGTRPQPFIRPYINNRMPRDLKKNLGTAFV